MWKATGRLWRIWWVMFQSPFEDSDVERHGVPDGVRELWFQSPFEDSDVERYLSGSVVVAFVRFNPLSRIPMWKGPDRIGRNGSIRFQSPFEDSDVERPSSEHPGPGVGFNPPSRIPMWKVTAPLVINELKLVSIPFRGFRCGKTRPEGAARQAGW